MEGTSERQRYTGSNVESQVLHLKYNMPGPSGDRTPTGVVPSGRAVATPLVDGTEGVDVEMLSEAELAVDF